MTLQQLTYFLAAARHGSFSAAAESLQMAQPSLSEQVRRLEAELGVPLFVRAGRGLELTEAGRLLVPHAERTLAEAQQAQESVREVRELTRRDRRLRHVLERPPLPHRRPGPGLPHRATRACGSGSSARTPPRSPTPSATARWRPGLIVLPVEDAGLDVRVAAREELLYISADPERVKAPITIEKLAAGAADPRRRALGGDGPDPPPAARARPGGGRDDRAPDRGRVPHRGAGPRRRAASATPSATQSTLTGRGYARRLHAAAFDPPIYETFAFITRRNAHLSPATREFMKLAERRVQALA